MHFAVNTCFVLLICLRISASASSAAATSESDSALHRARQLRAPKPVRTAGGEFEGANFWNKHEALLARAWRELAPRHAALLHFNESFEARYISRPLLHAIRTLRRDAASSHDRDIAERDLRALFKLVAPGVWATHALFTPAFRRELLAELRHREASGVPMRRPNGMNRYGAILEDIGLGPALHGLIQAYIKPLAQTFFPAHIGRGDADESFSFAVNYERSHSPEHDHDVSLAEHRDASVATLNVCLGLEGAMEGAPGFEGGELRFYGDKPPPLRGRSEAGWSTPGHVPRPAHDREFHDVHFVPGLAVLHLGSNRHEALPLRAGARTNMVVWLFGEQGVVRVAPRPEHERLGRRERWAPSHSMPASASVGADRDADISATANNELREL